MVERRRIGSAAIRTLFVNGCDRYTAGDQGQRSKGYGSGNPDSGHKTSSYETEGRLVGLKCLCMDTGIEYWAKLLFVCLLACILVGE